ncbi:lipopolysaccharide biosynthesis protein [Paracoccus benzoatiresistens]|uniref:Lipopolysaccharide biosynthesis protein n=1 Tax=Paracoccus benzoatiresistens TaxID=2997341 RepID=A0ABT4J0I6_9RHOB|nr:lipopolysaccharide biosynthesis protein [Paracoccus sp. EF6]MCZ0960630.1 lipopolysaccharide biosynthesis protein [Paracoccus sp. EF6]
MSAPDTPVLAPSSTLLRRLGKNLAWIFSSQAGISVLGLVSLGLTARSLGPAALGYLAMIEAYTRLLSRLLHLEPWQATVFYGTQALEQGDSGRFGRLMTLSLWADLAGGLLAGGVAILLAAVAAPWMGMPPGDGALMLAVASAAQILALRPTGIGALRIYDRFDVLAVTDAATALLRMALIALAWLAGAGLWTFVLILVLVTLADGLLPMAMALREMRRHGHRLERVRPRGALAENPGFLHLLWNSNANVILRQMTQRLDIILLSPMLPAAAIGFYQLARRIGEAALRIGRPFSQVVYPELTRMAVRNQMRKLGRFVLSVTAGLVVLEVVVVSAVIMNLPVILVTVFGPGFADAVPVVTIQAIAVALYLAGMMFGPAMLAIGLARDLSRVTLLTTIIFFAILLPMTKALGIEGAAATHLVTNAIWLTLCGWLTLRRIARLRAGG